MLTHISLDKEQQDQLALVLELAEQNALSREEGSESPELALEYQRQEEAITSLRSLLKTPSLVGKKFKTLVVDEEWDDVYGVVTHPIGSIFTVLEDVGYSCRFEVTYKVGWEEATTEDNVVVPGKDSWTLWTAEDIIKNAEEICQ